MSGCAPAKRISGATNARSYYYTGRIRIVMIALKNYNNAPQIMRNGFAKFLMKGHHEGTP